MKVSDRAGVGTRIEAVAGVDILSAADDLGEAEMT